MTGFRIKGRTVALCAGLWLACAAAGLGEARFPAPEFDSEYELPLPTVPAPRGGAFAGLDVAVLFLALVLAAYLGLARRSRRGLLTLTLFSLGYFGFWRKGCVCSVGAVQNVDEIGPGRPGQEPGEAEKREGGAPHDPGIPNKARENPTGVDETQATLRLTRKG